MTGLNITSEVVQTKSRRNGKVEVKKQEVRNNNKRRTGKRSRMSGEETRDANDCLGLQLER